MCTNFLIKAGEQGFVNGRSMEFGIDLRSQFFFRKAGHHYDQRLWGPNFGFAWTGTYGFVGMNAFGLPLAVDGMNTEGLATGDLWLPATTYQTVTEPSKGLCVDNFGAWLLSSFKSCREVADALNAGTVQVGGPEFLTKLLPLHFPVHDAGGESIVIEFIDGAINVHDNPVGVLTNDPVFPWHLDNLQNYVSLTPWDAVSATFNGVAFAQSGHGTGLTGIPGDPTPPSRFVRAAAMTSFAEPVATLDDAANLALHVLNTVDIPKGIVLSKEKNPITHEEEVVADYTQWVVTKDLTRRIYSARFYGSSQVQSVDLTRLDLDALNGKQLVADGAVAPSIDRTGDAVGQSTESAVLQH